MPDVDAHVRSPHNSCLCLGGKVTDAGLCNPTSGIWVYLFGDKYLFFILPNQQRARSDFCLILYIVNYGRVGKYIMRKSKSYFEKVSLAFGGGGCVVFFYPPLFALCGFCLGCFCCCCYWRINAKRKENSSPQLCLKSSPFIFITTLPLSRVKEEIRVVLAFHFSTMTTPTTTSERSRDQLP
jgi:hypothetical protein